MPTIVGLRRRGYTPESLQLFAERIGVTKSDSWIDYSTLEGALRDDLDPKAAARHGGAGPGEAGDHQLGRGDGRDGMLDDCTAPGAPARRRSAAGATSSSAARCGSNAPTTKTCRPRASSACSPATRCA